MPQKPQVRAKEKRRLTRRLAAWRAKQIAATPGGPTPLPHPNAKPPFDKG